jgi:hypothetical protein
MSKPQTRPVVLDLSPDASRFLDIVVELAHLDDELLQEVNDRMLDAKGVQGRVELDELRRVVAVLLDGRMDTLSPDQRALMQREWPVLFG